jgi:hypothetical protein
MIAFRRNEFATLDAAAVDHWLSVIWDQPRSNTIAAIGKDQNCAKAQLTCAFAKSSDESTGA